MNEELIHIAFDEFIKNNTYYKESLDVELENYYALFKAGYDQGYDEGFDAGLYNSNDMLVY